jgi:hypothetical protein
MDCLDKCDKCNVQSGPKNQMVVDQKMCKDDTVCAKQWPIPVFAHFVARKKAMSKGFQNHHRTCKTVQKWT